MKIATFNINNVNKRLANLVAWLRPNSPAGLKSLRSARLKYFSEPACTELTVILRHGCPFYSSRADMISVRINVR